MNDDTADPSGATSIAMTFDLKHPPAKVWRALTEPALLAQWLLTVVDFRLEPGATFKFMRPPMPEWDGIVHCRLLEAEPHLRLKYTWLVGELDTIVTFTLTPTATGTHLALLHEGFRADQKRNSGGARYGWHMMGDKLVALLPTFD